MTILSRNEMIETLNGLRSWSGYDPLETTHPSITKVLNALKADRDEFELLKHDFDSLMLSDIVGRAGNLWNASPAASNTETK